MITAKPVVKNKLWILQENNKKIGTVDKSANGYVVRVQDQSAEFKTIKVLKNRTNIVFEDAPPASEYFENQVNGFPTDCKPHNPVYNVHSRLPLFTKDEKSKSWYAAGYYRITINGRTKIQFCPKLIMLERYDYIGPVKTRDGFDYK